MRHVLVYGLSGKLTSVVVLRCHGAAPSQIAADFRWAPTHNEEKNTLFQNNTRRVNMVEKWKIFSLD
jgi:hypothetical protein